LPGVRLILRLAIRRSHWQEIEPLLEVNLKEHEEVARLDDGAVDRYAAIRARVLLLGGRKSPPFVTTELFEALERTIPDCEAEIIDGLERKRHQRRSPSVSRAT
jgi:hypothetical protein